MDMPEFDIDNSESDVSEPQTTDSIEDISLDTSEEVDALGGDPAVEMSDVLDERTVEETFVDELDKIDVSKAAKSMDENLHTTNVLGSDMVAELPDIPDERNIEELFGDELDEIDVSQEIKSIMDENLQKLITPQAHGHWTGEPGNSEFVLDDDFVPTGNGVNPEGLTMRQIKDKHKFEGIYYKGKEPDFTAFVDSDIGAIELETFSTERTGKGGTYDLATEKAAKQCGMTPQEIEDMMQSRGLTWHECGDRKTLLPIPTEINAAFKHTGGISIEKNMSAFRDYLADQYGSMQPERSSPIGSGTIIDLDLNAAHKQLRKNVKVYKLNK